MTERAPTLSIPLRGAPCPFVERGPACPDGMIYNAPTLGKLQSRRRSGTLAA